MRGLIEKDLRLLKSQGKLFYLIVALCSLIWLAEKDSAVIYFCYIFEYLVLMTVSFDEFDNGMNFLLTLPITRKLYVQEKYIFGIVGTFLVWLFNIVIILFLQEISQELFFNLLINLLIGLFILVACLSLFLKFGAEKGRIIFAVIIGVVVGFICFFRQSFPKLTVLLSENFTQLVEQQYSSTLLFVTIFTILFILGSYVFAVKAMEKKEF